MQGFEHSRYNNFQPQDSVQSSYIKLISGKKDLLISFSYAANKTGENEQSSSIAIKEEFNSLLFFKIKNLSLNARIHSELSYIYLMDSVWLKNRDLLLLELTGTERNSPRFSHSYGLLFNTSILNDYKFESTISERKRIKKGKFLNPSSLQVSYGFLWKLPNNNELNFSLATIRFNNIPKYNELQGKEWDLAGSTLLCRYGFGLDFHFQCTLLKRFKLKNESHFFSNSTDHNAQSLIFITQLEYVLMKKLIIRGDTRFTFEPMVNKNWITFHEVELCYSILGNSNE